MGDVFDSYCLFFKLKRGSLGSDFELFDMGKGINDFFCDVVIEIFIVGVWVVVDEREDSDGVGSYVLWSMSR